MGWGRLIWRQDGSAALRGGEVLSHQAVLLEQQQQRLLEQRPCALHTTREILQGLLPVLDQPSTDHLQGGHDQQGRLRAFPCHQI